MAMVGCATPSSPSHTSPDPETRATPDSRQLLATLRTRRAEIAQARSEEHVDRGHDLDLQPLMGLSQEEIRFALGQPDGCGTEPAVAGNCKTDEWEYNLFHLPESWLGGGTILFLQFDAARRCRYVRWIGSK